MASVVIPEGDLPNEIDLDGQVDAKGVQFIGKATRTTGYLYRCLANVASALCIVEVRLSTNTALDKVAAIVGGDDA